MARRRISKVYTDLSDSSINALQFYYHLHISSVQNIETEEKTKKETTTVAFSEHSDYMPCTTQGWII